MQAGKNQRTLPTLSTNSFFLSLYVCRYTDGKIEKKNEDERSSISGKVNTFVFRSLKMMKKERRSKGIEVVALTC